MLNWGEHRTPEQKTENWINLIISYPCTYLLFIVYHDCLLFIICLRLCNSELCDCIQFIEKKFAFFSLSWCKGGRSGTEIPISKCSILPFWLAKRTEDTRREKKGKCFLSLSKKKFYFNMWKQRSLRARTQK
jgi:hypothetical protein